MRENLDISHHYLYVVLSKILEMETPQILEALERYPIRTLPSTMKEKLFFPMAITRRALVTLPSILRMYFSWE